METRMRKAAFTILGALLIAGSAAQAATASEHPARAGRSHHHWDRSYNQLREPSQAIPQAVNNYGKPPTDESRTCDIKWCYRD
jgi:hypothetical protein